MVNLKEKAINWAEVIARAIYMYDNRGDFAYYYGCKGSVLTEAEMLYLEKINADYFKQYSPEKLDKIHQYSLGKIGLDCSAFCNFATGQYKYSTAYWESGLNKTTPKNGTWGNMLYTTFGGKGRHIGIDIGGGRFLHMPKEGRTVEMGLIADYAWEGSAQFDKISYTFTDNK